MNRGVDNLFERKETGLGPWRALSVVASPIDHSFRHCQFEDEQNGTGKWVTSHYFPLLCLFELL